MSVQPPIVPDEFRVLFPEFKDPLATPDSIIELQWEVSGNFISHIDSLSGGLSGATLRYALQLLTAHLLKLMKMAALGQPIGFVTSASEGDVSVSLAPPPIKGAWEQWLAATVYGMQLWSLLSVRSVGGWAVGGLPERNALRKVGGIF